MVTEKFSGKVESAYGKVLPSAVSFDGSFEKLEQISEIPDDEKLGPADILDVVNARRKASARAKATVAALEAAGIAKPDPNDPAVARENMIKLFMKQNKVTEAVATRIIDAATQAALQAQ